MSRFNKFSLPRVGARSVISTTDEIVVGFEGNEGFARTPKSTLFLLSVSFMGGDDNFYEKSDERYTRLIELCNSEEVYSDTFWLFQFIKWIRNTANMRTVAIVIATEVVRARLAANITETIEYQSDLGYPTVGNRDLINVACSRADEPAEIMAYWLAKYGKQMPWPIRNGIADAAIRLYNEFSYLKYGARTGAAVTMRDVLRMCRPTPDNDRQAALFGYITGTRLELELVPMIASRQWLNSMPRDARIAYLDGDSDVGLAFRNGGMTWETVSEWSPEGMSGRMWDLMIPNMGIMALLRNIRNFDQSSISRGSVEIIQELFKSRDAISKSRILPYRWYQAYRSVESVRWSDCLDIALNESLRNIPILDGHSLVLVDMSGSMFMSNVSDKSDIKYSDIAALFGTAWKISDPESVDLYQFGSEYIELSRGYMSNAGRRFSSYDLTETWLGVTKEINLRRGSSVLRGIERFQDMGGTETHRAVAETFVPSKHRRVVIITDEQAFASMYGELPVSPNIPVYVWNLAGYRGSLDSSGSYNRHTFGGITDDAFKLIPILESNRKGDWPWSF